MEKQNPISKELIAPCGMNCAVCSRYLAYVNNLNKSQCVGCKPRNSKCSYLFGKCKGMNKNSNGNSNFCFECTLYPCKEINRMDERYRTNYNMSMKDNLERIKKKGISIFIKEQYKKHSCSICGGLISVHNRKCFKCETITKLIEKAI
jgi:hypothetical protein